MPGHRVRNDSELDITRDAEENSRILIKDAIQLRTWAGTVDIKTPNLFVPTQIASVLEAGPFTKLAVSPHADRFAVMSHNRILDVFAIEGEHIVQESSVQVLEDECAEYCLLEFSASGNLLLSTRSSPEIDVFDHSGGYCYDINLQSAHHNMDLTCAVSSMKFTLNTPSDDKFMDILYVLQYNGTFSCLKIGRLARYEKMFSVSLGIGLAGTFELVPGSNLLLVSSHYRSNGDVNPPGGLCSFRIFPSDPFIEPIRIASHSGGWLSKLAFATSNFAFIHCMSLSLGPTEKKLAAVDTNGDVFIFDIPSTSLRMTVKHISGANTPKPTHISFSDVDEVIVLYNCGRILRSTLGDLQENLHTMPFEETSFSPRSCMVVPCAREIFVLENKGSIALTRPVVSQRTTLAMRLWGSTLWTSFKQLVGMAVGEQAQPLQMATHREDTAFVLWHIPTRTLQELFERTLNEHDYDRARSLAQSFDTIDRDIVLKREWKHLERLGTIAPKHVGLILEQIADHEWIAGMCGKSEAKSLEVHRALVKLATSLSDVLSESRIHVLHNARILAVCEDVERYLKLRTLSCLQVALQLAKESDFVALDRLWRHNFDSLAPHQLRILSAIPCVVAAARFEHLLPKKNGAQIELEKEHDAFVSELEKMSVDNSEDSDLIANLNSELIDERAVPNDFVSWVVERLNDIDASCGVPSVGVSLLQIAVHNGYQELSKDLEEWKQFERFVDLCSLVVESMEDFRVMGVSQLAQRIQRLTVNELVRCVADIVDLVKWKLGDEGLLEVIEKVVVSSSTADIRVASTFRNFRPELVSKDLMTRCLKELDLTGEPLLKQLLAVDLYPELASALQQLAARDVRPTFRRIHDSLTDVNLARGILLQMASCGQARSKSEWELLRDDVMRLARSLYSHVVSREWVVELMAREILADREADAHAMRLVLTLDKGVPDAPARLGLQRSVEVMLEKSEELLSECTGKDDWQLDRARQLAQAAVVVAPKMAKQHLNLLDTVELIHDLGSNIMPLAIKFADADTLLEEVINIGANYRQGKKCARLAQLLGVSTPVASALSLCALVALDRADSTYLAKYMNEVVGKARGLAVVYRLCVQIMETEQVPMSMKDIYACALLNCDDEQLFDTMALIDVNKRRRAVKIEEVNGLCDMMVQDDMYTKAPGWSKGTVVEESIQFALANADPERCTAKKLASLLAYESASAALYCSLFEDNEIPWTENEQLDRYEKAIRHFMPKLSVNLVEAVTPNWLISRANMADTDATALDRIACYGVDRERFIEDATYRKETIIGLAMTEDEAEYGIALELCTIFSMETWPVHMASLNNALTSLSISEAKQVIKARGHLSELRKDVDRFHTTLRSDICPVMRENDRFLAYLTLFTEGTPEKTVVPTFKKLLEKKKDLSAVRLFKESGYVASLVQSMPDKVIESVAPALTAYEAGAEGCLSAARFLLNGSDFRPPAGPLALFGLVSRDETEFLDLVADMTREAEISYLERTEMILDATPNAPENLKDTIKSRLSAMRDVEEVQFMSFPQDTSSRITRRKL